MIESNQTWLSCMFLYWVQHQHKHTEDDSLTLIFISILSTSEPRTSTTWSPCSNINFSISETVLNPCTSWESMAKQNDLIHLQLKSRQPVCRSHAHKCCYSQQALLVQYTRHCSISVNILNENSFRNRKSCVHFMECKASLHFVKNCCEPRSMW